jgi:hypothetical protein
MAMKKPADDNVLDTAKRMWASYASNVMPTGAPEVQLTECRRAFMAGAWAMLQACKRVGEPDVSEEAGVIYLSSLEAELAAFYRDVKSGKA